MIVSGERAEAGYSSLLRFCGGATLRGTVTIVLLDMGFHGLFGVAPGMNNVTSRDVRMVCRGFVASGLMMFGSFFMMASRVDKVFRDFLVVSCSLLRHGIFSS
jgi:hypothetical protein